MPRSLDQAAREIADEWYWHWNADGFVRVELPTLLECANNLVAAWGLESPADPMADARGAVLHRVASYPNWPAMSDSDVESMARVAVETWKRGEEQ